jgi:hypothetical protein
VQLPIDIFFSSIIVKAIYLDVIKLGGEASGGRLHNPRQRERLHSVSKTYAKQAIGADPSRALHLAAADPGVFTKEGDILPISQVIIRKLKY